jgi:pyruvate dehydrogenase E2 component (dihydrolipoamide acetyltransferase)
VEPEPPRPAPAAVAGERVTPVSLEDDRLRATPRARRFAEEKSVDLHEVEGSGPLGAIVVSDVEAYLAKLETQSDEHDGVRATPLALRVASDLGVDLEHVKGTGPGGRITRADVLGQLKREKESAKAHERELFRGALQLSQKRKALIRNMVRSKAEAPHFYIMMDVRTDALKELRDRLNREAQESAAGQGSRPRLTYTHLMVKACALALEAAPEVNATYRPDEHDIAIYEPINIGLAVDVNDELVAPTIKDCQGKDLWQLADESNALVQRARMRKLQPQDYADGTFTISNLGMLGVDRFYAIITPPQSSILSVGAMTQRPIVENGQVIVANMTTLGLSVDHRVLDGAKAAQFLGEIRRLLEHPEELIKDGTAGH